MTSIADKRKINGDAQDVLRKRTAARSALALLLAGLFILAFSSAALAGPMQPVAAMPQAAEGLVEFSRLGAQNGLNLQGPLDMKTLRFSLPADWKFSPGAELRLELSGNFASLLVGQEKINLEEIIAGRLDVSLNGVLLGSTFLKGPGERSLVLPIPENALAADAASGMFELTIQWDASASCEQNVATNVAVSGASSLFLPHETAALSTDLTVFPKPFYQENDPFAGGAVLAVPDAATPGELQAALSIVTGMGRLTGGKMDLRLVPAAQLTRAAYQDSHLILVGKAQGFSLLQGLPVRQPPDARDGFLQMFVSPWNRARALLLVSGQQDQAVFKAATALSYGTVVTTADSSLAVVNQLPLPPQRNFDQDQTFAQLGQGELTFRDPGVSRKEVVFYVPADVSVGAEAYFDLTFNHSSLIDYLRSDIVVRLNGTTVGSIRMSDNTADINSIRLILPASAIRPSSNHLEIQVGLVPRNVCSDPRQGSMWMTVFPESFLHLPAADQPIVNPAVPRLDQFPISFSGQELDKTSFIVSTGDPASWGVAAQLAFSLGAGDAAGARFPALLAAEEASQAGSAGENIILVEKMGQMAGLQGLVSALPAPFETSGQFAADVQPRLAYQFDPAESLGFLEIAASPVNPNASLLAVLGSDEQGVAWAGNVLLQTSLRRKLAGNNFAVVQRGSAVKGANLLPVESAQAPGIPGTIPLPAAGGTAVPPATGAGSRPASSPRQDLVWLVPLLVISTLLIVLLTAWEVFTTLRQRAS